MTGKERKELGEQIQILGHQLDGFEWPNYAFDELTDIQHDLLKIAEKLLGE